MKTLLAIKGTIIILGFIFYMFNRPLPCQGGLVLDKIYLPPYITEVDSYSILFDAPIKEKRRYPEKYLLIMKVDEEIKNCEVSEELYTQYSIGDIFLKPN